MLPRPGENPELRVFLVSRSLFQKPPAPSTPASSSSSRHNTRNRNDTDPTNLVLLLLPRWRPSTKNVGNSTSKAGNPEVMLLPSAADTLTDQITHQSMQQRKSNHGQILPTQCAKADHDQHQCHTARTEQILPSKFLIARETRAADTEVGRPP